MELLAKKIQKYVVASFGTVRAGSPVPNIESTDLERESHNGAKP